ncbi:hypothetical protein H0E87_031631 [Populus deltoides]|uniref:Uncharacterized protein n=1 Tax=Populus deltoides TaxID=3696 RepID=A0A8T2WFC0_POPDE|nr:hypothetical protein H0E87_031631 [Populus deltoides]
MLCLRYSLPLIPNRFQSFDSTRNTKSCIVVCAAKVHDQDIREFGKQKENWDYLKIKQSLLIELEFPLIAVKSIKSSGGATRMEEDNSGVFPFGINFSFFLFTFPSVAIYGMAEDGRLDEVRRALDKVFSQYLEATPPRMMFDKMISIYYKRDMHDQDIWIVADMEELGLRQSAFNCQHSGKCLPEIGYDGQV